MFPSNLPGKDTAIVSGNLDEKDDRLVKVGTAPNEPVAQMWKGALEAEGIPAMVKPTGPGWADYSVTVCPHYIYVLGHDEERARALLDTLAEEGEDPWA